MIPTSRDTFKTYCMRKLGAPVIEINVSDEQIDDRVDEALLYFADYHFDGSDKIYYKYQLNQNDIINRYIQMPDNVIGVVDLFDVGESIGTSDLFNIRYQIALNDLYVLNHVSVVPYYMTMQNIQFLEQILVGKQPLRYNRHTNRCYIDMDWSIVVPGQYLIVVAYTVVDPNEFNKVWGDRWLARYASCLIKQQWGENLSKFRDMKLPGGVSFDAKKIYDDATTERLALEKEMIISYSIPCMDATY